MAEAVLLQIFLVPQRMQVPDALTDMCRDTMDVGKGGMEGVVAGAVSADGAAKGEEGEAGDVGVDEQCLAGLYPCS